MFADIAHLGTVWPDVPTLVQALHSPAEPELVLELEKEELESWELEELENWPLAPGRARLPEVDTVTAGPCKANNQSSKPYLQLSLLGLPG